jgi:hypothetical protein
MAAHPPISGRARRRGACGNAVAFSDSLALGSRCGVKERGGSGENER